MFPQVAHLGYKGGAFSTPLVEGTGAGGKVGATAVGKKIRADYSFVLYTVLPRHFLSHVSPRFLLKPSNLFGVQNTTLARHSYESPRERVLAIKAILWDIGQQQDIRNYSPLPKK